MPTASSLPSLSLCFMSLKPEVQSQGPRCQQRGNEEPCRRQRRALASLLALRVRGCAALPSAAAHCLGHHRSPDRAPGTSCLHPSPLGSKSSASQSEDRARPQTFTVQIRNEALSMYSPRAARGQRTGGSSSWTRRPKPKDSGKQLAFFPDKAGLGGEGLRREAPSQAGPPSCLSPTLTAHSPQTSSQPGPLQNAPCRPEQGGSRGTSRRAHWTTAGEASSERKASPTVLSATNTSFWQIKI